MIQRGHEVDIYSELPGESAKIHGEVLEYGLLERTYFFPRIPPERLRRLGFGVKLAVQSLLAHPGLTRRAFDWGSYSLSDITSFKLLANLSPKYENNYDIVHCQFGTVSHRGMLFRQLNTPQAKLVTTFRGYDISRFVKSEGERVYDSLWESGDFFLANCEYFRQEILRLGCPADRTQVLRSGLDSARFPFKPPEFPNDGCLQLMTTGRLVEKKGIEYAIRAVAKLAESYPDLEYKVVGDGELREFFQQLGQQLGLGSRLQLLGWKNQAEIIELLTRSHIFLAPSVTAQNGNADAPVNVLKEAMAVGLPVISTYHGGIPELVEDGVSGFLVPERDAEAIFVKLSYLVEHPEQWAAMGKAGRAYVEAHYDLNQLNDCLVEIYEMLLETSKSQPQKLSGSGSVSIEN